MMKSISKELIGASAAPIILSVLKNGDNYGYEIVMKVKELTNDEIKWKEASIYPVLKKLETEDLLNPIGKYKKMNGPGNTTPFWKKGKNSLNTTCRNGK